jgi:hypothetical protein
MAESEQPRAEVAPIYVSCGVCGSESKLMSVVPAPTGTAYNYECPKGHRSQFVAPDDK